MPTVSDFPARGKVIEVKDNTIVFQPAGSTYRIQLLAAGGKYDGPTDTLVTGIIRTTARKVWTVPSGGNFVEPIYGRPRIVQGRVRYLDEATMVVLAVAPIVVELPKDDTAFDLSNGPIGQGSLVNAVVHAGASFEWINTSVHRAVGASVQ